MTARAAARPKAAPRRIGRFELRGVLGRGAQATVWRAWDDRLEREVAVKLLDPMAGTVAVDQWLHEARAVSRLTHPNVVPVFEAGEDARDGQPYLVFELVEGETLSQRLKASGALPARDAALLMCGVLDGLAAAHAAGVVHRDLKPSNVLVGRDGRPRVMDFGIAARVSGEGDGLIVGTPGFMSPEASRGEAPTAAMDVFSAGMMIALLLCGRMLLREADPYRAIERVQAEDFALPEAPPSGVDDGLRSIVQRAIARDPVARWADAAAMRDALRLWLQPPPAAAANAPAGAGGTLDFLLRRMRHKSDFPALSDAIARIQRIANSESASLAALSEEILKDVALTNKLLRLVNTAQFSHAHGGSVATVSRAVALVGFAGIRNLAMSLVLIEHMQDKSHAARLKDEFLRSLMAATLAEALCSSVRTGEEAFLVGMLQTLGRLLTEFYFPDEAVQVRTILEDGRRAETPVAEEDAALQVLGIGFEALGAGVAKAWGLPEATQRAMRRPQTAPPRGPVPAAEQAKWLGHVANELTDAIVFASVDRQAASIGGIAERHAKALGLTASQMTTAIDSARERLAELARGLGVRPAPNSPVTRLLATTAIEAAALAGETADATAADSTPAMTAPSAASTASAASADPSGAPTVLLVPDPALPSRADQLEAGIRDVTQSLVADDFRLDAVLRAILETMLRALALRRIVLCLREPRAEMLVGRIGLGEGAEETCRLLRIPLRSSGTADLFGAVCHKGADLLIDDARQVEARLPAWYREGIHAPAFLLLPLTMRQAPFGLIYGDCAKPGGIRVGERELAMLRTLRNQAVMAFKTAGAT